ncbi:MAG: hypothetical protein KA715_10555 [Xanthomonadaceae bacterium]|nr:hypothetical protein [Xanthomonadaceae bacterium]
MKKSILIVLVCFFSQSAFSQVPKVETSETKVISTAPKKWGMSYFSFWDGPGLEGGLQSFTPNDKGKPLDTGLSLTNLISVKYRFSEKYSIDVQNRIQWIQTNSPEVRFQAPRVGISGKFASGQDWSLSGALNTDIPGVGYIVSERTILFNPGLFANFAYTPSGSRWSVFALLTPRVWFYGDRDAVEPQWIAEGLRPGQKPEMVISLTPTVNYAVSDRLGLRAGATLDVRKFVESNWAEWKRWRMPTTAGLTYKFSPELEVYTFVNTFPFDGPGLSLATSSLGMWISGVIL